MFHSNNLAYTSSPIQALHCPEFLLGSIGQEPHPDTSTRVELLEKLFNKYSISKINNNHNLLSWIEKIHDINYLKFLASLQGRIKDNGYHIPTEFSNNFSKLRKYSNYLTELGVYASDTCTPVNKTIWNISRESAISALTAADHVKLYSQSVFALTRPPGHHAGRKHMNNFCYLNNIAIAANYLSQGRKKVAILDLDFHHGNGTQELFYDRNDIFTISLHADPKYHSPHFSGYEDECGEKEGLGFNKNFILDESITETDYLEMLHKVVIIIKNFKPDYLCIALGFDIFSGDPIGTWKLPTALLSKIIKIIQSSSLPILFTLEGGYNLDNILSFEQLLTVA